MKLFDNSVFDTATFWKSLAIILVLTPIQKFTGGAGYGLVVPFVVFAIFTRKVEAMIFWLLLSMTFIMGNSFFLPKGPVFFMVQRGLFFLLGFTMLAQIFGRQRSPQVSPLLGMMFYVAFMALTAAGGWSPAISYLKLFLFTIVYLAYYGVANLAGTSRRFDIRKARAIVLAVSAFLIFGSVALIPFPAIGQLTGEDYVEALKDGKQLASLFKGMTMHSQALGPIVASIFTFLFADFAVNVRKPNGLYVALLLCCPVLILKSSSRTGMAAMIVCVMMVGYCLVRMRGVGVRWRKKIRSLLGLAFFLAVVAVALSPGMRDSVVRFALKYNQDAKAKDFTTQEMMRTRQFLIDEQMMHFKQSPLIGNGFQVSADMAYFKATSWRNYLSASIEKGVWVTAVLEEGGVIGLSILCIFILSTGLAMLRRGAYTGLSVFFALIVSNMAEFTMFSMSAMGGFFWCMVFVGAAMDAARIRQDKARLELQQRRLMAGARP